MERMHQWVWLIRESALEKNVPEEDDTGSILWAQSDFLLPHSTEACMRALPKVASCLKCRQAFGWPSRSRRWYRSLLLGTVLRFLSCFTGISGCITTTHRIKDVSWTWKTWATIISNTLIGKSLIEARVQLHTWQTYTGTPIRRNTDNLTPEVLSFLIVYCMGHMLHWFVCI